MKPLPDLRYLHVCLRYDPATGILTWRLRPPDHFATVSSQRSWNTKHAGKPAGSLQSNGYVSLELQGSRLTAHRLAWVLMTGNDPAPLEIDHRNGNPADNRWTNLRLVDRAQNMRNARRLDSEFPGVSWHKGRGKWRVYLTTEYKQHHFGLYDSFTLAVEVSRFARSVMFGEHSVLHRLEKTYEP